MNLPAVLVPFKAKEGKSRLSSALSLAGRRTLSELMLLDVLKTVGAAGLLRRCVVVSSDPRALSIATRSGASTLREPSDRGVNAAVKWAMKSIKKEDRFMVLPSDLPLLNSRELRTATRLGSRFGCVISPSKSFNGTNLFIFSRKTGLALSYDSDSFWNHVRGAARNSSTLAVYSGRGVLFDVDSADDLEELAKARINTPSVEFARKAISSRVS